MLLRLVKFQKLSPLTLLSRRHFPTVKPARCRFSSDKQNPPPPNGGQGNSQDGNGSKTGVPESKKIYTEAEVEIMRLRSELEKNKIEMEKKDIQNKSELEKKDIRTEMGFKLMQKDIDMFKQKDEENKEKMKRDEENKEKMKRDEEIRRGWWKPRNWTPTNFLKLVGVIATFATTWLYFSGNKIQEKLLGVQSSNIYTKEQIEALMKQWGTKQLKIPSYYVPMAQLEKKVDSCLKYLDRARDREPDNEFFQILTGFPGYGKSTAFAKRINVLREEAEKVREEQNRQMEEKMTFWERLKFWEKPQEQPYRKIFYIQLRDEDENTQKKTQQQKQQDLEKKKSELHLLLRKVAQMSPQWKRYVTIVIDDINRLGTIMDSKQIALLESAYFGKIRSLSWSQGVNVVCISSSQWFTDRLYQVSQVRKQSHRKSLPLPTDEQRKSIIKRYLEYYTNRNNFPSYMEDYFMANYSSIRNIKDIIKKLSEDEKNPFQAESKSKWLEDVKAAEKAQIDSKKKSISFKLRQLEQKISSEECRIVMKCLVKDYKIKKITQTVEQYDLLAHEQDSKKLGDRHGQKILDKLSEARAVDFNQIISEIDMWALENLSKTYSKNGEQKPEKK